MTNITEKLEETLTYMERQELKKDLILIYLRADTNGVQHYFLYLSILFLVFRNIFLGLFLGVGLLMVIALEIFLIIVWKRELMAKYYKRLGLDQKAEAK